MKLSEFCIQSNSKLQTWRFLHQTFQVSWNKKTLIITSLRDFPSNFLSVAYSQIQNFDCKKPQRFSIRLFEFLYKWNLKSMTGNFWGLLQSKVMGDLTYTPFDWQVTMKSLYPTRLWTKYLVAIAVLAHFLNVFKNSFLKIF